MELLEAWDAVAFIWRHCDDYNAWWRYQMETFSALLAIKEGNPLGAGGFPAQRPIMRSFELWGFIWSGPEQTVEQTIEMLVISDAITLIMTSF